MQNFLIIIDLVTIFCAKLFSASKVSAIMTTATDRLVMIASFGAIAEKSGMLHSGMPGSTAASVCTPHSLTGRKRVISAPAAISATAIGNFGITFLIPEE